MKSTITLSYKDCTIMGCNFHPLVKSILRHYHIPEASCLDYNDLLQEAFLGILEAQQRFNPDLGVPFEAFAATYIHKYANDAIHRFRSPLSYPTAHPLSDNELRTLSTETVVAQDDDGSEPILLIETVASDCPTPEQILIALQDKHILRQALAMLSPREQLVLTRLYGLDNSEPTAAETLAQELNCSIWAIHKIRERASRKLKKNPLFMSNFAPKSVLT